MVTKKETISMRNSNESISSADQVLYELCMSRLREKYGDGDVDDAELRLRRELHHVIGNGYAEIYLRQYYNIGNGEEVKPYVLGGAAAGSFICYLLGISHVNPIDERLPLLFEFVQGYRGDNVPDIRIYSDDATQTLCKVVKRYEEQTADYPSYEEISDDKFCSLVIEKNLFRTPGMDNRIEQDLLDVLCPEKYVDLVKIICLEHSIGAWENNGKKLLKEGKITSDSIIASKEDIFEVLDSHMVNKEVAFNIAECISRGGMRQGSHEEYKEEMIQHDVPEWFVWSCGQIKSLISRAQGAELTQMKLRRGYYELKKND